LAKTIKGSENIMASFMVQQAKRNPLKKATGRHLQLEEALNHMSRMVDFKALEA
jgi:hypothetical protein